MKYICEYGASRNSCKTCVHKKPHEHITRMESMDKCWSAENGYTDRKQWRTCYCTRLTKRLALQYLL